MTQALGMPAEAVAGMRGAPYWAGLEAKAHTLAYDLIISGPVQAGNREPLSRWASVAAPTLVMDGGASPDWMHAGVRALANVLPNATHRTLAGQTHSADPAILAAALVEYFAGVRSA